MDGDPLQLVQNLARIGRAPRQAVRRTQSSQGQRAAAPIQSLPEFVNCLRKTPALLVGHPQHRVPQSEFGPHLQHRLVLLDGLPVPPAVVETPAHAHVDD